MHNLDVFLQNFGQEFSVERNGEVVATHEGLPNKESNGGTKYIGFRPGVDIQPGDWVINTSGERFYVKNRETQSPFGKPYQLKIYYDTEFDYNRQQSTTQTVFNITNASGSVIGNYNNVSISYTKTLNELRDKVENNDSPDKTELQNIVKLLEMIVDNKVPVSKGIFSKFSDVMERHSWITSAIASTILTWMTTRN